MKEKRNIDLWLAAGVLAVMAASLERAAVVYTIVKQCRSWVFVVLNILLLAILFTSKHADSSSHMYNGHQENNIDSKTETDRINKIKRVRKQPPCRMVVVVEDAREEKKKIIRCDDGAGGPTPTLALSNEELNERVEAFIATFRRQYLVSDHVSTSTTPANNGGGDILSKTITV